MAVAEIIGAAVGVLMLVVVAYILVGGTLTTAETVANAQKDLTAMNEIRLRTDLNLNKSEISITGNGLNFSVINSGNEIIDDFEHMDVYTFDNGISGYQHYTYDEDNTRVAGTWALERIDNDYMHPNQIDPGEKAWILAVFSGSTPIWVQVSTSNGVYAQTTFP